MLNLDLTDVPESGGGLVIPGTYYVIMDECEVKDTKSGTGSYINCRLKILDGSQHGRFLFHMFNIKNQNDKAVEIGISQLKTFMKCSGANSYKLTDVNTLVGMKCDAVVKVRQDDYGEKSVISYFKPHATNETNHPKAKEGAPF